MPGGRGKLRQARSRKGNAGTTIASKVNDLPTPVSSPTPPRKDESAEEEALCAICVEPIQFYALGDACRHTELCSLCAIRQRKLYEKKECPFCKAEHQQMIITPEANKEFGDYQTSGMLQMEGESQGLYFLNAKTLAAHQKLFEIVCPQCKNHLPSLEVLQSHVKKKHDLSYCQVCLDHVKDYLREFVLYTPKELQRHIQGDPMRRAVTGHPVCPICGNAFYDDNEQWMHMYNEHPHCGVCARTNPEYLFFKDRAELAKHYHRFHHPCLEPECLANNVVFSDETDLHFHTLQRHPDKVPRGPRGKKRANHLTLTDFDFQIRTNTPQSQRQRNNRRGRNNQNSSGTLQDDNWEAIPPGLLQEETQQPQATQAEKSSSHQNPSRSNSGTPDVKCELPPAPASEDEQMERNRVLIRRMKELLNESDFGQLRTHISEYVNNPSASPDHFHQRALQLLGEQHVHPMLAELMALLPADHESKRKALLKVHERWYRNHFGKPKESKAEDRKPSPPKEAPKSSNSSQSSGARNTVSPEQDYPSLSNGSATNSNLLSVGVYNSRHQGRPTQEDFPALQRATPDTEEPVQKPKNSNYGQSRNKKKRQQRKKTYLNIA